MIQRTPQLLSLRQTSPLPIVSGEYGRALLHTYEHVYGPAIGTDVAFAVDGYMRAGGYVPHQDAGRKGLQRMQGDFREHLSSHAKRFSEDLERWIRKTRGASFPPLDISPEEATWRIRTAIVNQLIRTFDNAQHFHEGCILPLIGVLQQPQPRIADVQALPVAELVDEFYATNEYLHDALHIKLDAFCDRSGTPKESIDDVSFFHHAIGTLVQAGINAPDIIAYETADLQNESDVQPLTELLSTWHEGFTRIAIAAYRSHLVHTLERIDREALTPLEELIERFIDDAENASLAEELKSRALSVGTSNVTQNDMCKLWHGRLIELLYFLHERVPDSDEPQADISYFIHKLGNPRSNVIAALGNIVYEIDTMDYPVSRILENIESFRATIAFIRTAGDSMPALRYAELLGAHVISDEALPEGIDEQVLRKTFTYTIGNALDFPREPHEYAEGEAFEVVVTVRKDVIEVSDNGRGMTPERMAEVRQAIEHGHELVSVHGGTGRGLAIDVGQHLLPKLFPNAPDAATLTIDSTLGVGTKVTINYPPSIVGTMK